MKIKIWGCRGSIPSPGKETIKYGGETTCIEMRSESGQLIIIDAGSGIRKLGNALIEESGVDSMTLLFTHAHWDHLAGFPFFRPAYFSKYKIYLCGGPVAKQVLLDNLKQQMQPPFFPIDFNELNAHFETGCSCNENTCNSILPQTDDSFKCESIPLRHPDGGYGFKFTENNKSFVFLTDNEINHPYENGKTRDDYVEFCRGAKLLIHDAQYFQSEYDKRRGWGHSTYEDAIDLAIEAGVKNLGIFHHDPDRTDTEIDNKMNLCKDYIIKQGSSLKCFACVDGMQIQL